ncbi:MAG: hypothetical protein F4227_07560 [Gammaproteobacteria bacterium]|nr:hypothetical protein [Gammaproteobacteria bacterium]MYF02808.1 hypothetical protein [Gammaproteobacteria bacterium]
MSHQVRSLVVLGLAFLSYYAIGDDLLGTYIMYDVDQETGEVSDSLGLTTITINQTIDEESYSIKETVRIDKADWEKIQAERIRHLEELSSEEKREMAVAISGDESIDHNEIFDKYVKDIKDENYEDEAKSLNTLKTTTEVTIDGNSISFFIPLLGYEEKGLHKRGERKFGRLFKADIQNGELVGTCTWFSGPRLPPYERKIYGKRSEEDLSASVENIENSNTGETKSNETLVK